MLLKDKRLTFSILDENTPIPYELLLQSPLSNKLIDGGAISPGILVARQDDEIVGVIELSPMNEEEMEIKNVLVKPTFNGQGIDTYLIKNAIRLARREKYHRIYIGTSNSNIAHLYFYQKLGFEICEIKKGFITQQYPEPFFENGIQAKDMVMLMKEL